MKLLFLLIGLGIGSISPKATFYYPVEGAYTASGKRVDPEKVLTGEHRWIAVSHDLKKIFSYGDTVLIESSECPGLNGPWVVSDLMHRQWKNKIDFLLHPGEIDSLKFWMPHKVKIIGKKKRARN